MIPEDITIVGGQMPVAGTASMLLDVEQRLKLVLKGLNQHLIHITGNRRINWEQAYSDIQREAKRVSQLLDSTIHTRNVLERHCPDMNSVRIEIEDNQVTVRLSDGSTWIAVGNPEVIDKRTKPKTNNDK